MRKQKAPRIRLSVRDRSPDGIDLACRPFAAALRWPPGPLHSSEPRVCARRAEGRGTAALTQSDPYCAFARHNEFRCTLPPSCKNAKKLKIDPHVGGRARHYQCLHAVDAQRRGRGRRARAGGGLRGRRARPRRAHGVRRCVEIKFRAPHAVDAACFRICAMAWRFHAIDATLSP